MVTADLPGLSAAFVVFDPNDNVLLLTRGTKGAFPASLGLPAGHVRLKETVIAAAWRELVEETSIPESAVRVEGYVGSYSVGPKRMVVFYGVARGDATIENAKWYAINQIEGLSDGKRLAPNVKNAVEDAFRLKREADTTVRRFDLADGLAKAQKSLYAFAHHENGRCGWNLYLGETGIGTLASSLGLLALKHCGARTSSGFMQDALKTLLTLQNSDGGWSTRSTAKVASVSVTESTACALLALSHFIGDKHDSCRNGIQWLLGSRLYDGSWGSTAHDKCGSVYATAVALEALAAFDTQRDVVATALTWLKGVQHPNGGWPTEEGQPTTAAHTAHAIVALIDWHEGGGAAVGRGVQCLREEYARRRQWADVGEVRIVSNGRTDLARIEFKHWSMPWAAIALCRAGVSSLEPDVSDAVSTILGLQRADGTWDHPLAAGRRPIWAVHDAIRLLVAARDGVGAAGLVLLGRVERLNADILNMASDINVLYLKDVVRRRWLPRVSYFANLVVCAWLMLDRWGPEASKFFSRADLPWPAQFALSVAASVVAMVLGGPAWRVLNRHVVQRVIQRLSPVARDR